MNLNDLSAHIHFSQRTLLSICAITAMAVFITLVYSVWQWQSDWKLAHQPIQEEHVATPTISTAEMVASIKNGHLFGKAATKLGDMPITNLQLHVTGIVKIDSNQGVSKAYISIDGQPSKIFKVGETLPYGVKVYEITPNAVVLENDGHLEKLPLPRGQLKFKPRSEEYSR